MLIFFILTASANWWEPSVVVDLTDTNYKDFLNKDVHVVIEYFAPFCHWCRVMFHEYEELSKHYNSDSSPWRRSDVLIARVNSMDNPELTQLFQIYAFPTIIFVPAHSTKLKEVFQGLRMKSSFIEWIEGLTRELESQDFDKVKENSHEEHLIIEETQSTQDQAKGNKHENHDDQQEEIENFAKFEMVIEDVSGHTSEKWRGEFNAINIKLDELRQLHQENSQESLIVLSQLKQSISDQMQFLSSMIDRNYAKIEEVAVNIVNRNNIENTQSRFNPTHMIIFIILGAIIGFTLSVYLVKIRPAKEFNKI